jgi:cell division-specific peptidoglycan biosynthesis regulator FtsW
MMPIALASFTPPRVIDIKLLLPVLILLSLGIVMVASSSLDFANARYQDPWFFVKKQSVYLLLGLTLAILVASVPLAIWQKFSGVFCCWR